MHGHSLPSDQGEVSRIGVRIMSNRSLALAMATLASMQIGSAEAQSVYVAPGGVYVAGGPVYVIPAPNNGVAPYVAPTNGYGYGPPAVVAPLGALFRQGSLARAPSSVQTRNSREFGSPD